jgi:hypothetical protein
MKMNGVYSVFTEFVENCLIWKNTPKIIENQDGNFFPPILWEKWARETSKFE